MDGIEKRLNRISRSLYAIENGGYAEFTLGQCVDYIGWVSKFKKVPKYIWEPLCEKIIFLYENGY